MFKATEKERIAIVDAEKCKPNKCNQECKKSCPVVALGKLCIEVTPKSSAAKISETLCNGCNICTKMCPFSAIKIVNLPANTGKAVHRYGANGFVLYKFPLPRRGNILGLVGNNGIGKSTALKLLSRTMAPNFGFAEASEDLFSKYFRGTETQWYSHAINS